MKGKFAVVGTLALVLAAAGPAAAQEGHRDITLESGKVLMEVKVPSSRLYDRLYSSYDFVEAVQRNGDGSLSTDVLVNPEERALLQAQGVQFVQTLETDAATERRRGRARGGARRARRARRTSRRPAARPAAAKSAIPLPGEVTIQRAYTFTNYAGRFLYVEAHTKAATPVTADDVEGSPTMALSFAGAGRGLRRRVGHADLPRQRDRRQPNNNTYMYHRHLVRRDDRRAQDACAWRRAPAASTRRRSASGSARRARRTPQGYLTGFFTRYMDPTEITDRFMSLAAEFPNIAEIVNLPNLTHGYRRPAQTVMGVPLRRPVRRPDRQLQRRRGAAGRHPRVAGRRRRGRQRPLRDLQQPGRRELAADRDA